VPDLGLLPSRERTQSEIGHPAPTSTTGVEEDEKRDKSQPSHEASGMRVTTTRILASARDSAVT
jgi:hypothetical protein